MPVSCAQACCASTWAKKKEKNVLYQIASRGIGLARSKIGQLTVLAQSITAITFTLSGRLARVVCRAKFVTKHMRKLRDAMVQGALRKFIFLLL